VAKDGPRDEWIQQLNCYRWLAKQYGVEIHKLQIVAIYRDWSKRQAGRDDYPKAQVEVFTLPIWPDAETEAFIMNRIDIHENAKKQLPICLPEETWERPEKWAVHRMGGKRAIKLHDNQQDAQNHCLSSKGLEIEYRPAERPRCEDYCRVAQFCSMWQEFKRANAKKQNP
jgi:hypothetical protein